MSPNGGFVKGSRCFGRRRAGVTTGSKPTNGRTLAIDSL
jgi:hypothetical protein